MNQSTIIDSTRSELFRPRVASAADVAGVAQVLADGFYDDPVLVWCYPDNQRRKAILPTFFETIVRSMVAHGEVYTTDGVIAGAVWLPPNTAEDEQLVPTLLDVSGEFAGNLATAFELMDEQHPHDPHHYLFLIATSPQWRGRGVGSGLMRPVLDLCDRDMMPAYLEATSECNRALYLRHGFELVGEIKLPNGPSMWPMWREPS
jgi:GNAT superfamily N-acetyltransferase